MDTTQSYRITSAINEVAREILSSYENVGKTTQEVQNVIATEIKKYGGEEAMGSSLLWITYVKKDIVNNSLITLGLKDKN